MSDIDAEAAADVDDITETDARILDVLADGRNVPSNIADETDRHVKHVSQRLSTLLETGLIRRVGRKSVSLYEITERGREVRGAYHEFQAALQG